MAVLLLAESQLSHVNIKQVMSKELSNLTLLISFIESGTKTELLMFKAGIMK